MIVEKVLSSDDRDKLSDSKFGIPELRKYPMPDADHVRAAIKMFNRLDDKSYEKELASNIIKFMKKYKVDDIQIGDDNRFSKYYKEDLELINPFNKSVNDYLDYIDNHR
jgi:hypothetical protein